MTAKMEEKKKFDVTPEQLFNWIQKNRILNLEDIKDSIRQRFDREEEFAAYVKKPNRPPVKLITPQQFCGICTHYKSKETYANPQSSEPKRCTVYKDWVVDVPFLGCCESFKLDKKELEGLQAYDK